VFNSPIGYSDPSGLAGTETLVRPPVVPPPVAPPNGFLGLLGSVATFTAAFTATFFSFTQPTADDDYFPSNPLSTRKPIGTYDKERAFEPYRPDPNSCQQDDNDPKKRQCIPISTPPVSGGSHYRVRTYNIGGEAHHMPSFGVIRGSGIALKYDTAPAICMRLDDHYLTDSRNPGIDVEQVDTIKKFGAFGFEIVQGRDIAEIRGKFGTRYDFGINQMRNYTRQLITTHPEFFQQR
jgi:hypothetical protein